MAGAAAREGAAAQRRRGACAPDLLRAQIGARLGLIRALTLGAQPHVGTRKLGCQALRPPLTRIELSLGRRRAGDRSGVSVLLLRAMDGPSLKPHTAPHKQCTFSHPATSCKYP